MQRGISDLWAASRLFRLVRVVIFAVLFIACLARCGHALNPDRSISQYAHSAWRLQDGFIGAPPNAITQTMDGYIWIATESGLVRFDGVRFTPWVPPGAEGLQVLAVLGTTDGSLWIGTQEGYLFQWRKNVLTSYAGGGYPAIDAIAEEDKGRVWIARYDLNLDSKYICEAGEGRLQCYELRKTGAGRCCSLTKAANGDLWIGGRSLVRWRPRSSVEEQYTFPAASVTSAADSVALVTDGSVWIATDSTGSLGGLQHFSSGGWSHFHSKTWDSSGVGMRAVLFDTHGALWAGTLNQGLYRIFNGQVDHYGSNNGLSSDKVTGLFEDHEGNLWVTTQNGVDCFRDLAVTAYSSHEGLRASEFDTVYARRNGSVWVGGDSSLDELQKGKYVSSMTGKHLAGKQFTSLLQDSHGRMWVGLDETLSILEGTRFNEIKRPDGKSLGMVVGITEAPEGTVWAEISAKPRELVEINNSKVVSMFPVPEMPAARKVAAGTHGDVWLGLLDGRLARYQQGKLDFFQFAEKSALRVSEVGVEPDGTVLGATEYGLVGWREGQQRTLSSRNGLPCDGVNTFIRDDQHALWLDTQCGLIRVAADEFQRWWNNPSTVLKMRLFDSADGMQPGAAPFQQSARSSDGKLWFVNQASLQMIDPSNLPNNRILPPVHVEEIIVADQSYSPQANLQFSPATRNLSIQYTALSYVAPQKVRFRYMLEGQDNAWQDAGTRRQAFYTNLRPKAYRFRVVACNNDGLWNEVGDSVNFTISPAYYQTKWFEALCVLAFAGSLWSIYLFRLNQVTSEIQGRLGARLEERERIARELHDTLLQGFQGLMLRFQAVMKTLPIDQPAHHMLEKVLDRADEVLFEGRQSVRDLRDKRSFRTDLAGALADCGDELALGHSSHFCATVIGVQRAVAPLVFDDVYRIAREALINAFQHSKASKIEAEIIFSTNELFVRVRDDGIGIDSATLTEGRDGHWGLSGMRERAKKIGAQLGFWSSREAGTEVELRIPAKTAYLGENALNVLQRIRRTMRQRNETKSL